METQRRKSRTVSAPPSACSYRREIHHRRDPCRKYLGVAKPGTRRVLLLPGEAADTGSAGEPTDKAAGEEAAPAADGEAAPATDEVSSQTNSEEEKYE
mgnify:CR=1 FL=1